MQPILAFDEPQFMEAHHPEEEVEFVMSRRQVAAITFLALVVLAVCSGASYLAGKVTSAREEPAQPVIALDPAPASTPVPMPPPTIEATIVAPPKTVAVGVALAAPQIPEPPLYSSPVPQAIYIQVGAVEKGVATVIAEGLRKHSLDSFVAPGPSEKTFRVLIGPFPDAEAYQKAQSVVDRIGLASFARRYQSQ